MLVGTHNRTVNEDFLKVGVARKLGKYRMVRHVLLPAACRASSSKGQQSSFLSCRTSTAEVRRWKL
jgi:hypothetical protein